MKKSKQMATLLVGLIMTVLMMESCNESSSNRELTQQEIRTAYLTVAGTYTGKMVYLKNEGNYETKTDTIDISWTIDTDSTMTIHDFPTTPFAEFVSDSELKEALSQQLSQEVKCKISFYNLSPVYFYIGVDAPTYYLTYGGAMHKVQLAFYANVNSCGGFQTITRNMEIHLVGGGIYEDDIYKEKYLSTTNIPILLYTAN